MKARTRPVSRFLFAGFAILLIVGPIPRGEAALFCRTTERRIAECCCEPSNDPCASEVASASCGCCEVQFSSEEAADGAAPLVPKASWDRIDAGAWGAPLEMQDSAPPAWRRVSAPGVLYLPSFPSLHILHRVLLC